MTLVDDVCRTMDKINVDHALAVRRIQRRHRLMLALLAVAALFALVGCSGSSLRNVVDYWPVCGRCERRCAP